MPVANQGVIFDYENNLQRQLQGHVPKIYTYSVIKYRRLHIIVNLMSLSQLTRAMIPCWLCGTSQPVLPVKLYSILILMESLLWI